MHLRRDITQRGYTLAELVIGMASSTLLVGGLASTLFISSRALNPGDDGNRDSRIAGEILADMMADFRHAKIFSDRTTTAATFTVPDRTGDNMPETIRYAWSGTIGDPLTYQFNGGPVMMLADDVQHFRLTSDTRQLLAADTATLPGPTGVVFEEFTESQEAANTSTITVATPGGTAEGDLLIAAVAQDGPLSTMNPPAGWTVVDLGDDGGNVTLGVWWKLAGASEPVSHQFTIGGSQELYGWIMRLTGHDPTNPINATASNTGSTSTPSCPAVTTTVDECMIVRFGGFDDDDVTIDNAGVAGHTTVTMDESGGGTGTSSGGAAYATLATAGDSGTADFTLTGSEQYRTVTIAIAPEQP